MVVGETIYTESFQVCTLQEHVLDGTVMASRYYKELNIGKWRLGEFYCLRNRHRHLEVLITE